MEKSVKSGGRTVEEAIQTGLANLQVERDRVEVELLGDSADSEYPVMVQLTVRDSNPDDFAPASASMPISTIAATPTSDAAQAPTTTQDVAHGAKQVLETLLRGMGIRSQVTIHRETQDNDGPDFVLDIVGADLSILIGRRGETLRDLEYLARLIVASRTRSNERFMVDVEGYRTRRELGLRELAKRMADRVKQNRQPITLEAMPPNERRIVHITLQQDPSVKTQSIGEGDRRRVMILPK